MPGTVVNTGDVHVTGGVGTQADNEYVNQGSAFEMGNGL